MTENSYLLTFNEQFSHHIETSLLICRANQLTVFYMIGALVFKELNHDISCIDYKQRKVEDKSKYKMKI